MSERINKPFSRPQLKTVDEVDLALYPDKIAKQKFIDGVRELGKDLAIKTVMEACYEIADEISKLMDHTPEDKKNVINVHPMNDIPQGLRALAYSIENNKLNNNPNSDSLTWIYGTEVGCLGKPMMNVDMAAVDAVFDLHVGIARMTKAALSKTPATLEEEEDA